MSSRRRARGAAAARLSALTRTAYTAAAGHLEVDPVPVDSRRRRRWALRPRVAAAAAAAILLLSGAVALRALVSGPPPVPVERAVPVERGTASATRSAALDAAGADRSGSALPEDWATIAEPPWGQAPSSAASRPAEEEGGVVVHVAGRVARPGIVELPAGARVHEAIDAAGGPTAEADLAAVNLARLLIDGEQVVVPAPGEVPPGASAPGASGAGSGDGAGSTRVNVNTATVTELDALPGIGPVLAGRIVEWREDHGRFTIIEELGEVAGIGPKLLGRLTDLVTL